jgi:hypothetical protein
MPSIVAFCSEIKQFHEERILDADWCRNFPGAEWLPFFGDLLEAKGLRLTTGDVALRQISTGNWRADDIIVISAGDSHHAEELIDKGARGGLIICAESPLYARTFYERVPALGLRYAARILFQGTINAHFIQTEATFSTRFPSFSRKQAIIESPPWPSRPPLVMVAGNKYWRTPFSPRFLLAPKQLESWLRGKFGLSRSAIKSQARRAQLHDHRLRLIQHFGTRDMLALYGSGWGRHYSLPWTWRQKLTTTLAKLNPQPCGDKKLTISRYRFAFAIENITYPGYHTEKIIDCFAAGVIPIYLGDPLIEQSIPREAFVHLTEFTTPENLEEHLLAITPAQAKIMLAAGRSFIQGKGQAYSYESFAENALALLTPHLQP